MPNDSTALHAHEADEAHDEHEHDELDLAILQFWDDAAAANGLDPEADWDAFAFGGPGMDDEQVDELAARVANGVKRATTALQWEHDATEAPLPRPGDLHIILDAAGAPRALVRTTRVDVMPICDVDDEFAAVEGEGDGTLAYWQDAHFRVFNALARDLGREPALDMPVVCERFELVYPAPTEGARS